MNAGFSAVISQEGAWWIGWVEEVPGVNAKSGRDRNLLKALGEALKDIIELNLEDALKHMAGDFEEALISASRGKRLGSNGAHLPGVAALCVNQKTRRENT